MMTTMTRMKSISHVSAGIGYLLIMMMITMLIKMMITMTPMKRISHVPAGIGYLSTDDG